MGPMTRAVRVYMCVKPRPCCPPMASKSLFFTSCEAKTIIKQNLNLNKVARVKRKSELTSNERAFPNKIGVSRPGGLLAALCACVCGGVICEASACACARRVCVCVWCVRVREWYRRVVVLSTPARRPSPSSLPASH